MEGGHSTQMQFFAWLVLHNKALNSDNMVRKNWPCDPNCQLYFCQPERDKHLLIDCNYAEATWNTIAPQNNMPNYLDLSADQGRSET
jgi:hypothetical protein